MKTSLWGIGFLLALSTSSTVLAQTISKESILDRRLSQSGDQLFVRRMTTSERSNLRTLTPNATVVSKAINVGLSGTSVKTGTSSALGTGLRISSADSDDVFSLGYSSVLPNGGTTRDKYSLGWSRSLPSISGFALSLDSQYVRTPTVAPASSFTTGISLEKDISSYSIGYSLAYSKFKNNVSDIDAGVSTISITSASGSGNTLPTLGAEYTFKNAVDGSDDYAISFIKSLSSDKHASKLKVTVGKSSFVSIRISIP